MKKINFIDLHGTNAERPEPANKKIPDWYKKQQSFTNDQKGNPVNNAATIKKCIPVFDSITSGYIISTICDLYVERDENNEPRFISSAHNIKYIDGHSKNQFAEYNIDYIFLPKIVNSWGIQTPPGYSCLILPPMHRDNIIEILPGVVDTDKYNVEINFPFKLKDKNFVGLIPSGTPIVQVIPFKRESWESNYIEATGNIRALLNSQYFKIRSMFFGVYKKLYWTKKVYK
jgi:hypothetical protein